MQTMILGGIAAVICWVAWQRHNRTLDEQAADSGRTLKPVPAGFDYQAARKQTDRINILNGELMEERAKKNPRTSSNQ